MHHSVGSGSMMKTPMTKWLGDGAARTRGQVLVLSCVAMLMVALMLMLSLNLTNAIHERVRIQAVSDAQALSVATLEARAFNTMAFMNRSIAAAMVGDMALHAWWTIAESDVGFMEAGFPAMAMVASSEPCSIYQPQHCKDAAEATKISLKFQQKARSYKSKLNGLNGRFRQAVSALNDMMKDIHVDQKKVLDNTKSEIQTSSQTLANIKSISARYASYNTAINGLNVSEFACALEGSSFDGQCSSAPWKPAGSVLSASQRTNVMEMAAMAARPKFEAGTAYWRGLANDDFNGNSPIMADAPMPYPVTNPQAPKDVMGEGTYSVTSIKMPKTWVSNNKVGADIGAPSMVNIQWRHGAGTAIVGPNGTQPQKKKESGSPYVGVPCNGDNCFVNFRASTSASADYGQPSTYGSLSQDLRLMVNGRTGPWEVNRTGQLQIELVRGRPAYLSLVPQGRAYAVAKGKTYFHQLGQNGWQTPPNMFDPFWRAKLQSFGKDELRAVLQKAGDSQGASIAGGGGAIEGKRQ